MIIEEFFSNFFQKTTKEDALFFFEVTVYIVTGLLALVGYLNRKMTNAKVKTECILEENERLHKEAAKKTHTILEKNRAIADLEKRLSVAEIEVEKITSLFPSTVSAVPLAHCGQV